MNLTRVLLISVVIAFGGAQAVAQTLPTPANSMFIPKAAYSYTFDKSWNAVLAALNANSIQVASAFKDAGQINTEFMPGPTEQGSFFSGALVTRYKFAVTLISVGKAQTQVNVKPTLQARRLAATAGKIMSGNNAVSDVEWNDATVDNPAMVENMRKWFYEQLEGSLR